MRKMIIIALLVLAVAPLTLAHTTKGGSADTAQAVESRLRAYLDALRKNDAAALAQLFADDYTYTGVEGKFVTKAQRLENFKSTPPPATLEFSDLKVHVYGDTAVVTGHVTSQAGPNGQPINQRSVWVWVKQGGTWRLVAGQSTNIGPA
jgi:uncharacterized protein (TIGR02246 family)